MFYYRHTTALKIIAPILIVVGGISFLAGTACSNYTTDCSCGIRACYTETPNWALEIAGGVLLIAGLYLAAYLRIHG
jgi:hypothetical protein